jgi:hypothetical protein
MLRERGGVPQGQDRMVALMYELLDAHADTVLLAEDLAHDSQWGAHVDYLRNLQRVARGTLARLSDVRDTRAADGPLRRRRWT